MTPMTYTGGDVPETRNMTPETATITSADGVAAAGIANKTQNFEVVAIVSVRFRSASVHRLLAAP